MLMCSVSRVLALRSQTLIFSGQYPLTWTRRSHLVNVKRPVTVYFDLTCYLEGGEYEILDTSIMNWLRNN